MLKHKLFLFLVCTISILHGMQDPMEPYKVTLNCTANNYSIFSVINLNTNTPLPDIQVYNYWQDTPFTKARIIINDSGHIFYGVTNKGDVIQCNLSNPNEVKLSNNQYLKFKSFDHQHSSFTIAADNTLINNPIIGNNVQEPWVWIANQNPPTDTINQKPISNATEASSSNTQDTTKDSASSQTSSSGNNIQQATNKNNLSNKTDETGSVKQNITPPPPPPPPSVSKFTLLFTLGKYGTVALVITGIIYAAYKKIPAYLQARKEAAQKKLTAATSPETTDEQTEHIDVDKDKTDLAIPVEEKPIIVSVKNKSNFNEFLKPIE